MNPRDVLSLGRGTGVWYTGAVRRAWLLILGIVFATALATWIVPLRGSQTDLNGSEGRASGFWTSTQPAVGGAYKYRLLIVGLGAASVTGVLVFSLLRNASRARAGRA